MKVQCFFFLWEGVYNKKIYVRLVWWFISNFELIITIYFLRSHWIQSIVWIMYFTIMHYSHELLFPSPTHISWAVRTVAFPCSETAAESPCLAHSSNVRKVIWHCSELSGLSTLLKKIKKKDNSNAIRAPHLKGFYVEYVHYHACYKLKKRLLLRRIHHFKSDLINDMDHMHISGTEPSSAILSQIVENVCPTVPKQRLHPIATPCFSLHHTRWILNLLFPILCKSIV